MANFLKFWAVIWVIGICAGLFGGGTETCYIGSGGPVDRFSQGFSSRVQTPRGLALAQGATDLPAAKSRAELGTIARLFGVLTGYFVGYSVHYALYAPACTGPQLNQAPK